MNDDFEVAAEFYMAALAEEGIWHEEIRGELWFRLVTSKIKADLLTEGLIESLEKAFLAKEIPLKVTLRFNGISRYIFEN